MNKVRTPATETELTKLMTPFLEQPFATPQMLIVAIQLLTAEIEKQNKFARTASKVKQEYGTASDIAAMYGCHRTTATRHLNRMEKEGKVRVRQFYDDETQKFGDKRYSLEDVDRYMEEKAVQAAASPKKESEMKPPTRKSKYMPPLRKTKSPFRK